MNSILKVTVKDARGEQPVYYMADLTRRQASRLCATCADERGAA